MSVGGDPIVVAVRFNEAINARDLTRLGELITEDHRFVDSEASVTVGREAVVRAWRWIFSAFPNYRTDFEAVCSQYPSEAELLNTRFSATDRSTIEDRRVSLSESVSHSTAPSRRIAT
jgi:hypothetical protein